MGWMYGEEIVVPQLAPDKYQRKFECDTVQCVHCEAIIKIVLTGSCSRDYDTEYRCSACDGPVCKVCAMHMRQAGGACTGSVKEKIDLAMKYNDGRYLMRRRVR